MAEASKSHNRLINVKTTFKEKVGDQSVTVVRRSHQVHIEDIRRHIQLKVHKGYTGYTNQQPQQGVQQQPQVVQRKWLQRKGSTFVDSVEKLNHAYTVQTCTSLNPTYSMSHEFKDFLYDFGNFARKYPQTHPLQYLSCHRQTAARRGREMGKIILSELKDLIQKKVASLKEQKQIELVMAVSLDYDHAYSPAMKLQIGCFALTVRTYETNTKEIKNYCPIPIKTFVINGKGDQTAEANAKQIRYVLNEMNFFENKSNCCSIAGDGAIVKPGLFKELGDDDFLHGMIFSCNSHTAFLLQNHTLKNAVDDAECGGRFPSFFPNYKSPGGKKLFFFGEDAEKDAEYTEFKTYLPYFFDILSNLETCSPVTKIRLTDYITELQKKLLIDVVKHRHKEFGRHEDKDKFEEELLQDMQNQVFTSSNPLKYFMDIYFNEEEDDGKPLKTNPLKIPNDPSSVGIRFVIVLDRVAVEGFVNC